MHTLRCLGPCVHGGRGQAISLSKCGDSSGGYVGHFARPASLACGWVYDRSPEGPLWRALLGRASCASVVVELPAPGLLRTLSVAL
jgi:hypothetical protein